MDVKRDILWRVYLCFLGIVVLCLVVLGKAIYIQRIQGSYWRSLSDSLHQKFVPLDAERGTIYSADSSMLSTSIPYFNIYIDFLADGLRDKNGKRFHESLDSLSMGLASIFKDRTPASYKKILQQGYKSKDRYFLLQQHISFDQYKSMRSLPLVRLGRNKSGFIVETNSRRLNPFGLLANRTLGLARSNAQNVGLERTYDTLLRGEKGSRLVRYMAAGTYIPVEGYEIEPENGKDIVTTIDVNMQDIAENALLRMMQENECEHGTCIVMEVSTGKIKAMANLGRQPDGGYWEDLNYAIRASEPGSTFKLATLLSLLEDQKVRLTDHVNLENGSWKIGRRTVRDAEHHEENDVSIKQAFEFSSNVGMAKLALSHYGKDPERFISHLKALELNKATGVDLAGETQPIIKSPASRTWSATTLPWMAFGYEVLISPLQTLTLYNAVANNGRMMKPYLVNNVQYNGHTVSQHAPEVAIEQICAPQTLSELKECLEGVCVEGTAKTVFKGAFYKAAGKTGTALVANGSHGYADHIYQSSFVGYFPADQPRYSCIVVIKNKPFAKKYLGAAVAGPVFREVADKLMSNYPVMSSFAYTVPLAQKDSGKYFYAGAAKDIRTVMQKLDVNYADSAANVSWATLYEKNSLPVINAQRVNPHKMPDLRGMGFKDAVYVLENMNMKVAAHGRGKVKVQSIEPGAALQKNQTITLELN